MAVTTLALHDESRNKLPIYPTPTPTVLLAPEHSMLEQHIGHARRSVTAAYLDAHGKVQDVVSSWIRVEGAIENRVKSLVAPDEPLTPGILYVGVSGLTGSILARRYALPIRLLLPPTLFVVASSYFLPKTTSNVRHYAGAIEDRYFPGAASVHKDVTARVGNAWESGRHWLKDRRQNVGKQVERGLKWTEEWSGLRLSEGLRIREGTIREKVDEVRAIVKEETQKVQAKAEVKVQEVKKLATETSVTQERKVEQVKEQVHDSADKEPKEVKRLV